ALDLFPEDVDCLVARASCHFQNGHFDSCIQDADAALMLTPKIPKAEFLKAESFYHKGEFEQSLICYHRANTIRPGAPQYIRGIKKAEGAIENSIGVSDSNICFRGFQRRSRTDSYLCKDAQNGTHGPVAPRKPGTRDSPRKHYSQKHPPKTVRNLLGELYGDWKYLEGILNDEEQRKARRGQSEHIKALAEKGLVYLEDRTTFWVQQRAPTSAVKSGVGRSEASVSEILTTIHQIQQAQGEGQFLETLRPAEKTLNRLKKAGESEIPDRLKLMGTIHSLIGSAHCETGNLTSASKHHQYDLQIADQCNDLEAKSRALDNLARVHIRCEKYSSAVRCFKRKIPLIQQDLEAAWLYHEMGRCHLELEHYPKAYSCAQKSMQAAKHTEDVGWQLNAQVLLAQANVELGEYGEAVVAFEDALCLAEDERDEDASFAIRRALIHVREK
ncbi:hypothetical protein CAPTEDRAFT_118693, partial [Capitella teleta]